MKLYAQLASLWLVSLSLASCATPEGYETDDPERGSLSETDDEGAVSDEAALTTRTLNLRVHIMRDISFQALGTGVVMTNDHLRSSDVHGTLVPEMNRIWKQAGIVWNIESVIDEKAVKAANFLELQRIVENADRDSDGHSDDRRLAPLYSFMDPANRSSSSQRRANLFHMYIFPFIGNTSQGNSMGGFGNHTVVGSWSNKSNRDRVPTVRRFTEDHSRCVEGSLGRTMAHEVGHVLGLNHGDCETCLMSGCGYDITSSQVTVAQSRAGERTPLGGVTQPPPTGSVELTTSRSVFSTSDPIVVSYKGLPAGENHWVGLYKRGAANTTYLQYRYATGTNGTLSFRAMAAGTHEARLFFSDSYEKQRAVTFTIK